MYRFFVVVVYECQWKILFTTLSLGGIPQKLNDLNPSPTNFENMNSPYIYEIKMEGSLAKVCPLIS